MNESLKAAMLSVHFHALGDRLELRGGRAVLLRPEIQPLPLDEALEVVFEQGQRRLREAVWALIRGVPPPREKDDSAVPGLTRRYGPEFGEFVANRPGSFLDVGLDELDVRRGTYRQDARGFAAALVAYSRDDTPTFQALMPALAQTHGPESSQRFTQATVETQVLGGLTPEGFLRQIDGLPEATDKGDPAANTREACVRALDRFEDEIGIALDRYIGEFADTVAFMESWKVPRKSARLAGLTVYPTSCVATQDARTLTTVVTGSALVSTPDFFNITRAIDPRRWADLSDVFHDVQFVDDAFALNPDPPEAEIGTGLPERTKPYLVKEVVGVVSDMVGTEIGSLSNVLRIEKFEVAEAEQDSDRHATLRFSLYRSIGSRVLWDDRAGGMLVDSGWTKVRYVTDGVWRMTSRKILRFSDRTPHTAWDGPLDFGQLLNYLSPAAVSAWLENDLYSSEDANVHGRPTTEAASHGAGRHEAA